MTANPANDLLDRLWQQKVQQDKCFDTSVPSVQPAEADPEGEAEATRSDANASAFRAFAFGFPLVILMWAIPTAAWLASGSVWVGLLSGAAEFVVLFWALWLRRGR